MIRQILTYLKSELRQYLFEFVSERPPAPLATLKHFPLALHSPVSYTTEVSAIVSL